MSDGSANGNPNFWIKLGHSGGTGGSLFVRDEAAAGDPDRLIVSETVWTGREFIDAYGNWRSADLDIHGAMGGLLIISGYRALREYGVWENQPIVIHGGATHIVSYFPDTTFRVSHTHVVFEFGNPAYAQDPSSETQAHVWFKAWNGADSNLAVMTDLDQFGNWTYRNTAGAERILIEPENFESDSRLTLGAANTTRGYLLVRADQSTVFTRRPGVVVLEGKDGTWVYMWLQTAGSKFILRAALGDPGTDDTLGVPIVSF